MVPVSIGEIAHGEAWAHSDQELAMSRRFESPIALDSLTVAAGTWLACGMVLYGLTPLPLRNAALGWSPAFWLLAAPCLLLVARRAFGLRIDSQSLRAARSVHHLNVAAERRRERSARRNRRMHVKRRAVA